MNTPMFIDLWALSECCKYFSVNGNADSISSNTLMVYFSSKFEENWMEELLYVICHKESYIKFSVIHQREECFMIYICSYLKHFSLSYVLDSRFVI